MTFILTLILLVLSLDFYIRHKILIEKVFKKVKKRVKGEQDQFGVLKKSAGDKVIDELEKINNNF